MRCTSLAKCILCQKTKTNIFLSFSFFAPALFIFLNAKLFILIFHCSVSKVFLYSIKFFKSLVFILLKDIMDWIKRTGYRATKYNFTVSLKTLVLKSERKPERIQVSLVRRYVLLNFFIYDYI